MATFADYALQYVLTDDEASMKDIAAKAAADIQSAGANSGAVFKWAGSVAQWMPNNSGIDDGEDDEDGDTSGDIIARAKALDFLAATLQLLDKSLLKKDQVKQLVGFFGALFAVDHKAGITAAARALRFLTAMEGFSPKSAVDIVESVSKMGDDFRLQTNSTRLEVYELLHSLMADPLASNELQYRHGASFGFMGGLLQLCRNERDPVNLLKWFNILKVFATDYTPSPEITEEVFKTFSAYFPISLRTSITPSGVTADDMKASLRSCFASHYRLAEFSFPFLLEKLDQGDAVTVSVKVDILQTINACLESYEHSQKSIVPYAGKIWSSLKYEVRNGEIPETIEWTLRVLNTLTRRLEGDDLKKYLQLVLRDCLGDLENPNYAAPAGKLLTSIAGAGPIAFAQVVSVVIPKVKENLNRTGTVSYTKDLLALLNAILGLRSILVEDSAFWNPTEQESVSQVSDNIPTLATEIYLPFWERSVDTRAFGEQVGSLKLVFQGMALFVAQRTVDAGGPSSQSLCPQSICSQICAALATPTVEWLFLDDLNSSEPELEDEAVIAIQKAAMAYFPGFVDLVKSSLQRVRESLDNPNLSMIYKQRLLKTLLSRLAFVGCSGLSVDAPALKPFAFLAASLLGQLHGHLTTKRDFRISTIYIAGIHGAILNLHGILKADAENSVDVTGSLNSVDSVESKLTGLPRIDGDELENWTGMVEVAVDGDKGVNTYPDFLQFTLYIVRQLYRRATAVNGTPALSSDFSNGSREAEDHQDHYLHTLGQLSTFVTREIGEDAQRSQLLYEAIVLFRGDDLMNDGQTLRAHMIESRCDAATSHSSVILSPENWGRTAVLSMAILQGLRPGSMVELFKRGIGRNLLLEALGNRPLGYSPRTLAVLDYIIMILSNKYMFGYKSFDADKLQWTAIVEAARTQLVQSISAASTGPVAKSSTLLGPSLGLLAGAIVRYDNTLKPLINEVCSGTSDPHIGHLFARSLEVLVSPKECTAPENHAVIKPLYRQWTYTQFIRPNWSRSFPFSAEKPAGDNFCIAILAVLKHLPFDIYEDDVEKLSRVLISSLTRLDIGPDLETALKLLFQVLANAPDSLKGHIKTLITGSLGVYRRASDAQLGSARSSSRQNYPASCRKLALNLLAQLPSQYEERYLLPHTIILTRMLANACGDSVREVRQAAIEARVAWDRIV